jgi:hypothetical protein
MDEQELDVEFFTECDCGSEIMHILYDDDDQDLWISFFVNNFFAKQEGVLHLFFHRIKLAWLMLTGKEFRFYEIIMNKEKAMELMDWLLTLYGDEWLEKDDNNDISY